jgi:hypothetical protein
MRAPGAAPPPGGATGNAPLKVNGATNEVFSLETVSETLPGQIAEEMRTSPAIGNEPPAAGATPPSD